MKCGSCGQEVKKKPYLEGFDLFWKVYPRKIGKGLAEKIWAKLKPDFDLAALIIDAVDIQKKTEAWIKDNGTYIPHPSTWLNQRRWEDEATKVKEEPKFDPQKALQKQHELDQIREREWERIHGGL